LRHAHENRKEYNVASPATDKILSTYIIGGVNAGYKLRRPDKRLFFEGNAGGNSHKNQTSHQ